MDKKRRGGPLDGIPEAKRPTRTASARSDRSAAPAPASRGNSASAGAGRAGAAGRGGAAAAGAAAAAPEAAPKVEETWEDIAERTGLSADDVLNRCAWPAAHTAERAADMMHILGAAGQGCTQAHGSSARCWRSLALEVAVVPSQREPAHADRLHLRACRKLTFKKGTLPAKKLEEMGPVIKELK